MAIFHHTTHRMMKYCHTCPAEHGPVNSFTGPCSAGHVGRHLSSMNTRWSSRDSTYILKYDFNYVCTYAIPAAVRRCLSWPGWASWARLSFGALLLHMPINKSLVAARLMTSQLNRQTAVIQLFLAHCSYTNQSLVWHARYSL